MRSSHLDGETLACVTAAVHGRSALMRHAPPPVLMHGPTLRWLQLALYLAGDVAWIFAWSVAIGTWIDASSGLPPLQIGPIAGIGLVAAIVTRLVAQAPAKRFRRFAIAGLGLL